LSYIPQDPGFHFVPRFLAKLPYFCFHLAGDASPETGDPVTDEHDDRGTGDGDFNVRALRVTGDGCTGVWYPVKSG
jgi:hypothetical protein